MSNHKIDDTVWLQHAGLNLLQSVLLLTVMAGFFALLGWMFWGQDGVIMLLIIGVLGIFVNSFIAPQMVMNLYGATPISPEKAPEIWSAVKKLSERAGLPAVPELYYIPSQMLNAFSVGTRGHSAIAITDGLLRELELRELIGVIAHEISHIRNNDLWVMGLADMFSRTTSMISLMGQFLLLLNLPLIMTSGQPLNWFAILLMIFAPNLSALAQLALSRTREYDADLNAARLTGDPEGLASALVKIEKSQGGWMEQVFLPGRNVPVPSLLRTHPETEARIKRLMELKPNISNENLFSDVISDDNVHSSFSQPINHPPRWHINGLWY
jgi:heat shock protein HtpX